MPIQNTAKIYIANTTDGVKDKALEVCVASGEDDIFIDMDTVGDRMPQDDSPETQELRRIIEEAAGLDASYIHIF